MTLTWAGSPSPDQRRRPSLVLPDVRAVVPDDLE